MSQRWMVGWRRAWSAARRQGWLNPPRLSNRRHRLAGSQHAPRAAMDFSFWQRRAAPAGKNFDDLDRTVHTR